MKGLTSGIVKQVLQYFLPNIKNARTIRRLQDFITKDKHHRTAVLMFDAATKDAGASSGLPDELIKELLEDRVNRTCIFRWIEEGVRPEEILREQLALEPYYEGYRSYEDRIFSYFIGIAENVNKYKHRYWEPQNLEQISRSSRMEDQIKHLLDENKQVKEEFGRMDTKLGMLKTEKYNPQWFKEKALRNVQNMGERYSPELHVEVQAQEIIDAIELSPAFLRCLSDRINCLIREYSFFRRKNQPGEPVMQSIRKLERIREELGLRKNILPSLNELAAVIAGLQEQLERSVYHYHFAREVKGFAEYIKSAYFQAAFNPFVLITGSAGTGKSHFITDQVIKRVHRERISIFLLGQLLNSDSSVEEQIRQQLELAGDLDLDDFLQICNSYGAAKNERVILFIDALNESRTRNLWLHSIGGFVQRVKKYSHLALVMSVRDTYESQVIPDLFRENNNMLRAEIQGFDDPDEAIAKYFAYYQIPFNLNDYLRYQFKNPLFLKVYCEAYDKHMPADSGVEAIFTRYFEKINNQLKQRIPGYPQHDNLVIEALECFIELKLRNKDRGLEYREAKKTLDTQLDYHRLNVSVLDELVFEKLLTVNSEKGKSFVYVAFEWFEDFLAAKRMIRECGVHHFTGKEDLNSFFSESNPYYYLLRDSGVNQGIFEALAILLPDLGYTMNTQEFELTNWPKKVMKYRKIDFKGAYYNSLMWRRPEGISGISHSYIVNESFSRISVEPRYLYEFWDEVLKYTTVQNHYYNAEYLWRLLNSFQERSDYDGFWTVYVSSFFQNNDSFKTIVQWAWNRSHRETDGETIYLAGMNMAWFMASTCDAVRDVTIKAMVRLFTDRLDVLLRILVEFRNVRDMYVLEGLCCAAYGCVLNTHCAEQIGRMADYMYKGFLQDQPVIPHAMIRNYISGIMEYALKHGMYTVAEPEEIRPPYRSNWSFGKVEQEVIERLRQPPSEGDIARLDRYNQFWCRYEFDQEAYFECKMELIGSLESCCTKDSPHPGRALDVELAEIIEHIPPADRINFTRMVIREIFAQGYNYIKFGEFDQGADGYERRSLGQKYEWSALNKVLAVYLDNKQFVRARFNEDRIRTFEGMWQFIFFRKIDPSIDYFSPYDTRAKEYDRKKLASYEELRDHPESEIVQIWEQNDWIAVNGITYRLPGSQEGLYSYNHSAPYLLSLEETESFMAYIAEHGIRESAAGCLENLYVKEIYWAPAYEGLLKQQQEKNRHKKYYARRVIDRYLWDINDGAMLNCVEFSILSPLILQELEISPGDSVFELHSTGGEPVAVSLYEQCYEDMLLLRKDVLSAYLRQTRQAMLWGIDNGVEYGAIIFDGERLYTRIAKR